MVDLEKRYHYCPAGDMDCPYYKPTITDQKTCGLVDAPEQCDEFFTGCEGDEDGDSDPADWA